MLDVLQQLALGFLHLFVPSNAAALAVGLVVGMLVAVESWVKRDHQAEWRTWVGRCESIAEQVGKVAGVQARVGRRGIAQFAREFERALEFDIGVEDVLGAVGDWSIHFVFDH